MLSKRFSILFLLLLPLANASFEVFEGAAQEIHAQGFDAPYFENKIREAEAFQNDSARLAALEREVKLQKEKMISLVGLTKSLEQVIQTNQYQLDTMRLRELLNKNDLEMAEAELRFLVEEVAKIEEGKAFGGMVNTFSLSSRIRSFFSEYRYHVLAALAFFASLFFLSYKTIKQRYADFRVERLERELAELHRLERETQDKYYNKREMSKRDFELAEERYTRRKLEIESLLVDLRDKFAE
ncbi:hypothetical protein HY501_02840 [Candidatus Woesearchaeota archaeon]|nr:hypothetical protein [Candidatus Woesearchaeota archaeon]